MLDDRVLEVLARLEREDADEREAGLPAAQRSRQVEPTTGRFLFALAASQAGVAILEIGGSRAYSSIWLAAGARVLGGRLTSLENDPAKCTAWRTNVVDAGLDEWAELVEGDAFAILEAAEDTFDLVFLDAEKDDYEALVALVRFLLEPGGLVVADNVLSTWRRSAPIRRLARPTRRSRASRCHSTAGSSSPWPSPDASACVRLALPPSARSTYAGATAERRWSGLSDDSTGSGGTSG